MSNAKMVHITKISNNKNSNIPKYATEQSAGMDLEADIDSPITLKPNERAIIPTGIAIALPEGYEAQIRPRSGLAAKHGITVLNSPGTIDADYRGEIKAIIINLGTDNFVIEPEMRIAQMVIAPYTRVDWQVVNNLDETERGVGGFGSTGTVRKTTVG